MSKDHFSTSDDGLVYTRVSDPKQSGASSQLTGCRALARLHGINVVAEVDDDGMSGDDMGRAGLVEVQDRVERAHHAGRPLKWIITDKTDRLSRADSLDTAEVYARLRRHGVRWIATPARNYDLHSSLDRTLLGIESDHKNHQYLKDLGRSVLNGMLDAARAGFWTGQKPPLGYRILRAFGDHGKRRRKSGRLELDPDTAPVVRELFERVRDGASVRDLARWLSARVGKTWSREGVYRILKRELYTGTRLFGRHPVGRHARLEDGQAVVRNDTAPAGAADVVRLQGGAPAIIDAELFALVQQRLAGGKHRAQKKNVPLHALAGLCRCSECGSPLTSSARDHCHYFCCSFCREQGSEACKTGCYIRGELLLDKVLATLAGQLLEGGDTVARIITLAGEAEEGARKVWEVNRAALEKTRARVEGELATARRRLSSAPDDLLEDYQRLVRELKDELAGLDVQRAALRSEEPLQGEGDVILLENWLAACRMACQEGNEMSGPKLNALLREVIDHVRVFPLAQPHRSRKQQVLGRIEVKLPDDLCRVVSASASHQGQHATGIVLVSEGAA